MTHHPSSVLNGDLITGESALKLIWVMIAASDTHLFYIDTFRENSTTLIDRIVVPLNEAKIPFSSTQGVGPFHMNRH